MFQRMGCPELVIHPAILSADPDSKPLKISQAPVAEKRPAPVWLRIVAGAVFIFGYWACLVLATVALLPAGTFRDLQGLLMLVAALLAGALALLSVRRQRTFFLALLMPVLLVLYVFLLNLLQAPARH
jgi:hypothetical protein